MHSSRAVAADGIVVGGTTGEGHLLSWEEHLMLIAHSVHQYSDKLIIIGNTGSNNGNNRQCKAQPPDIQIPSLSINCLFLSNTINLLEATPNLRSP